MLAGAVSGPLRYAEIRIRSMARDAMRVLHRDPKIGEIKLRVETAHELRRIEEAVAAGHKPPVAFLYLDDEEALLAQLRQYGVRELATIRAPGHGKMFPSGDGRFAYFDEILAKLRAMELGEALVLVGPGFTRDAFLEYLRAREPALASKVHTHGTAHPGMQGI